MNPILIRTVLALFLGASSIAFAQQSTDPPPPQTSPVSPATQQAAEAAAPAVESKPVAATLDVPSGVFFVAARTQNHITRSDAAHFHEAADFVEKFLGDEHVKLREDPVRKQFRVEGTISKESVLNIAQDVGAKYVLQLIVDRPATSWMELTLQCFDMKGNLVLQYKGKGANAITSSGHVEKAAKALTEKLKPKLGSECLPTS